MSSYRYLIVSGAGLIEWQIFSDATDEEHETTISVVPSYDKKSRCSDLKYLLVSGAGSIELPIFSDATDDEYETSTPGSPEQETVLPKATESNRPHIQNVFSTSTSQQQPSEDNI